MNRMSSYCIAYLGCADGNKYKGGIYMVFEYMDHDLTGLADRPGMRFSVPQIKVLAKKIHPLPLSIAIHGI